MCVLHIYIIYTVSAAATPLSQMTPQETMKWHVSKYYIYIYILYVYLFIYLFIHLFIYLINYIIYLFIYLHMCNCFVTNMGKVIPQSRMALLVMGTLAPA